jgi:hypothetical protein
MVGKQRRTVKKLHKRRNILKGYSKKKPHYIQKKSRRKKTSYKRKRPNKRTRGKRRKFILSGGMMSRAEAEAIRRDYARRLAAQRDQWAKAKEEEATATAAEEASAATAEARRMEEEEEEQIIIDWGDKLKAAALSDSPEKAAARRRYNKFLSDKTEIARIDMAIIAAKGLEESDIFDRLIARRNVSNIGTLGSAQHAELVSREAGRLRGRAADRIQQLTRWGESAVAVDKPPAVDQQPPRRGASKSPSRPAAHSSLLQTYPEEDKCDGGGCAISGGGRRVRSQQ